jgi:hypothetical protein
VLSKVTLPQQVSYFQKQFKALFKKCHHVFIKNKEGSGIGRLQQAWRRVSQMLSERR